MRVKSLVIFLVIAGAVAYVFMFKREWIWDVKRMATGYTAAKTPAEAMEKFRKAVNDRDSETAAIYCTPEYAEVLKRAAEKCDELGGVIDRITLYMTNKGLDSDKSKVLLSNLDPFPKIKLRGEPKKKDDNTYFGFFDMEEPPKLLGPVNLQADIGNLDKNMFTRALMPAHVVNNVAIPIVKDGEIWKLKIDVPAIQTQALDYFLTRAKSYHTALSNFRGNMSNERYGTKAEFESELVRVLQESSK